MDPKIDALYDAIENQIDKARDDVRKGCGDCQDAIAEVVEQASATGLTQAAAGGGSQVIYALDRYGQGLDAYLGGIQEGSQSQTEATERTLKLLASVDEVTAGMARVTRASRRLALNATITSSRIGDHGRSLAMVAVQFKELADEVREASERIRETAAALGGVLPRLSENAELLGERCATGASNLRAHNERVIMATNQINQAMSSLSASQHEQDERVREEAEAARQAMDFVAAFEAELYEMDVLFRRESLAVAA